MNLYSGNTSSARFYVFSLVIAAILISASISAAFGQERSEDRDKPTLLNSTEINDDLDGSDSQYFYKFSAGPGKLTLTFEVKASGTNAGAMLDLFDVNSRPVLSDVLAQGVDGGSERLVKSVQFNSKRDLVLRIKGLKYGDSGGTGSYKVVLSGAVNVNPGAPPAGGAAAPAGPGAAAPAGPGAAAPAGPGAAAPAGPGAAAPAGPGAAAPAGSNLLSGELNPADERLLFHSVNVSGPGQVSFSFNVKATDAKAGAKFAVLTEQGGSALEAIEVQAGESITKVANFDKAKTLTLLVFPIKFPDNAGRGSYSVQLSGPAGAGAALPAGTNSVSGQLDPANERPSFHFVNVNGPGQVTISFSVKATDAKAGAKFAVLAPNGTAPFPALDVQGGESVTKPLTLSKPQTLTILVAVTKPPDNVGGRGTYSIQVSGPVTVIR